MLEAVIFDMDGVIVDTEPFSQRHIVSFLEVRGVSALDNYHQKLLGHDNRDVCSMIIQDYSLQVSLEQLMEEMSLSYFRFLQALPQMTPVPGVRELIDDLSQDRFPLALASSASRRRIDLVMGRLGLEDAFKVKVSGYEVKRGKPEPDIFLLAAEKMCVLPSRCAVIEDSAAGVTAALKAGMYCIGYTGTNHHNQDLSPAHLTIKDLSELTSDKLRHSVLTS